MNYRAVENRCAVDSAALRLPIPHQDVLAILATKGFKVLHVDIVDLARLCVGTSKYRRGAKPSEAPTVVDCSSLTKWLYGQCGVWLPRRSIQQRELGEVVHPYKILAGDLVFSSGWIDYYLDDPADGVGHVGIATGNATIIHAANKKRGVIESPLETFIGKTRFRGARRYFPKHRKRIS